MLSCISSKIAVYLTPAFPFFVYLAVLFFSRLRWSRWLALTIALPASIFVLTTPILIWLGSQPDTQFLSQPFFYVAAAILTVTGLLSLFFLYRKKAINRSINTIAIGLFLAVFAGGWGLPAINSQIGFADLCHKAQQVYQEKPVTGYITFQIGRPESMDVFLHQDVQPVTMLGLLTNDYAGKLFLVPNKVVKKSSIVRQFIEGKESYNVEGYLIVVL